MAALAAARGSGRRTSGGAGLLDALGAGRVPAGGVVGASRVTTGQTVLARGGRRHGRVSGRGALRVRAGPARRRPAWTPRSPPGWSGPGGTWSSPPTRGRRRRYGAFLRRLGAVRCKHRRRHPRGCVRRRCSDLGLVAIWDDGDDLFDRAARALLRTPATSCSCAPATETGCAAVLAAGYARSVEAAYLLRTGWAHRGSQPPADTAAQSGCRWRSPEPLTATWSATLGRARRAFPGQAHQLVA